MSSFITFHSHFDLYVTLSPLALHHFFLFTTSLITFARDTSIPSIPSSNFSIFCYVYIYTSYSRTFHNCHSILHHHIYTPYWFTSSELILPIYDSNFAAPFIQHLQNHTHYIPEMAAVAAMLGLRRPFQILGQCPVKLGILANVKSFESGMCPRKPIRKIQSSKIIHWWIWN